jgi:hypothetical protein
MNSYGMTGKISGAPSPDADYGLDQGLNSQMAPARGEFLQISVRVDGTLNSNIDWRGMTEDIRKPLEDALAKIANTFAEVKELRNEASSNGLKGLADVLNKDLRAMENMLSQIKERIEKSDNGSVVGFQTAKSVGQLINDMPKVDLDDARARIGRVSSGDAPDAPGSTKAMDEMRGADVTAAGEDHEEVSAMGDKLMSMKPNEMLAHFSQNPETVWKDISKLPPEERGAVMQKLQMAVQEDNQLQSMLTNFIKAMHDTAKATISNLRV